MLRNQLEKHLASLKLLDLVTSWHDRNINAGQEWAKEIDINLNTADLILLLVSPDFLHSEYCYSKEMTRALERHENGSACVVPIILRHVDYEGTPFSKLLALPTDGRPITDRKWHNRDEAFLDVAQGIRKTVKGILSKQNLSEADIYFYRQNYNQALEAYERAIYFDSTNALAYTGIGKVLLQRALNSGTSGKDESRKKSLEMFEKAISFDNTIASAYLGKAEALPKHFPQRGVPNSAGSLPEIIKAYTQAIQLDPYNPFIYVSQAKNFIFFLKHNEALESYNKAFKLSVDVDPQLYKARGDLLYKIKRYKEAIADYEFFLKAYPKDADVYQSKGDALFYLQRYEEALAAYEKILSTGVKTSKIYDFYLNKGKILLKMKHYQDALVAFEKAIQWGGKLSSEVYKGKGEALQILSQEAFKKAKEEEDVFDPFLDSDDLP